jgi:hypothetical protein
MIERKTNGTHGGHSSSRRPAVKDVPIRRACQRMTSEIHASDLSAFAIIPDRIISAMMEFHHSR